MTLLIVGLALFLLVHSVRIFADDWRARVVARIGAGPYKLVGVAVALAFALFLRGPLIGVRPFA